MSLKFKFLVPTLILFIIGLSVLTFSSSMNMRNTLESMQEVGATELSQSLTSSVSRWISSIKRDVTVWSAREELINFAPNALDSLKFLYANSSLYTGVSIMKTDGIVAITTTEGNIGLNLGDRDYIKTALGGQVGISDINISKVTGLPLVAVAAPLRKGNEIVGAIYMSINIPALTDYFFKDVSAGQYGYPMIFNRQGRFLSHPQMKELNQKDAPPAFLTKMMQQGSGIITFSDDNGEEFLAAFQHDEQLGWTVAVCYQVDELYAPVRQTIFINSIIGLAILVVAAILVFMLVSSITRPLKNTVAVINELAEGEGDLTIRLDAKSKDEIGQLALAINQFIENLWQMIGQIRENSIEINKYADNMNQNTAEINEHTQQQAGAIEQTSSALEEITGSVHNNAASAQEASQQADQTYHLAQKGGGMLNQTLDSMKGVTQASQKINEIINVVNEIAFQTNLLALNAAVEAARAGEAGKGFAVVAGEVRNLAARSSNASKEIQDLITDSVNKIQASNELMMSSDAILKSIIDSIQKANETIAGISLASQEQSAGIGEINTAVQHMDQGVQRNSEMIASNFTLSNQLTQASQQLVQLVSRFRL